MLETNLRIVKPGTSLWVPVRKIIVDGTELSIDLLEKACAVLLHKHGIAATPEPGSNSTLYIGSDKPLENIHLEGTDWELDLKDSNEDTKRLSLNDNGGVQIIPILIERALIAKLSRKTNFWSLDSSRIWYEADPFIVDKDIEVYHRFEVSALLIEEVGVAVAVDVSTAFFTVNNLEYYFDPKVSEVESKKRINNFNKLTGRQQGQKGTLVYDNGFSRIRCYFEKSTGVSCSNTGKLRVKGITYSSLMDYYKEKYPAISNCEDKLAIQVSFKGIDKPQWVCAERVKVRVMNDNLPNELSSVDKIEPQERRKLLEDFWKQIEPNPLGSLAPGFKEGFWKPEEHKVIKHSLSELYFGNGKNLNASKDISQTSFRNHFQQRLNFLKQFGCYSIPTTIYHNLICAYPSSLENKSIEKFCEDIANSITELVGGKRITIQPIEYNDISEGIQKIKKISQHGVVIFILPNEEPAAYFEVSFNLASFRVKRLNEHTLKQHYQYILNGAWDKKSRTYSLSKGKSRWEQFIFLNSLDIIQQMDIIPWRINSEDPYESHIVIDVGHDRRYFAISLLISRSKEKNPDFLICTDVFQKTDPKHELINCTILEDHLIKIIQKALSKNGDQLSSILFMRDGHSGSQELQGIKNAINKMQDLSLITNNAKVDIIDIHKDTTKSLRFWEIDKYNNISNPLEGTSLKINNNNVLITTTGAATLHQGTADPILIVGVQCENILKAGQTIFMETQLNWSSPSVAQRLPITLKRTDEELRARAAQEIRRIG